MEKGAIITGGGSGLGLRTAEILSKAGYKVAIWDRKPPVSSEISGFLFCEVDVSDSSSVTRAVEKTVSFVSNITVLVNCAGIAVAIPIIGRTSVHNLSTFETVLNVNTIGLFDVCRQVCKKMKEGVIINVASLAAFEGTRGQCAYSASKAAVVGLTLPLARDLAQYNIRVVTIAPGHFHTPMGVLVTPKAKAQILNSVALKRSGTTDEFAHTVLFAVENTYLTGSVIRIDGGSLFPHI